MVCRPPQLDLPDQNWLKVHEALPYLSVGRAILLFLSVRLQCNHLLACIRGPQYIQVGAVAKELVLCIEQACVALELRTGKLQPVATTEDFLVCLSDVYKKVVLLLSAHSCRVQNAACPY